MAVPWGHAADATLVLRPEARSLDVWPATTVLADASRQWSIENVLARRDAFTPPPRTSGSLGVRQEAMWLRVPLVSPVASSNQWIVNIDFAVLNEVDFFLTTGGQVVQHAALGNLRPFSDRPLRNRTPATFAAYVDLGDAQIASASPERFVSIRDRLVETRPIKGTRRRSHWPEADLFTGDELLESVKRVLLGLVRFTSLPCEVVCSC